jgi:uncharacterized protein
MSEGTSDKVMPSDDPIAIDLVFAVHGGNVDIVNRLLRDIPDLAATRFVGKDGGSNTALHMVTDWPGYFPNGPEIAHLLIDAGADPDAPSGGGGAPETPLHYAASSDDADVAEVLIDRGADLEIPDGSIGTPLDNAVGYACWNVARLLVARGAAVERPWQAAALGMLGRLGELLGADPEPEEVSQAIWHACAGGQRRAAEELLARGADLSWVPDYADGTPLDAATGTSTRQESVITWLREHGAPSSQTED